MTTFDELRSLAEISDPVTRARRLSAALTEVAALAEFLSAARRGAVAELRDKEMTFGEIAVRLHVSPARAAQIFNAGAAKKAARRRRRAAPPVEVAAGGPAQQHS